MMKRILLLLCVFISVSLAGQAPVFEWAIQTEGPLGETSRAIATDKLGNVYIAGDFSGTADFDPSMDTFNLISTPAQFGSPQDIFISKYDTNGALVWAISFGDIENDRGFGITTDTFGNVYVTGSFRGTIDFDPGSNVYSLSSSSNTDGFVLKLDTNGSFLWARNMGGAGAASGEEIVVDDSGNVYAIGTFSLTADLDPGSDVYNLTDNGFGDVFILKLDSNGDFVWAKAVGGVASDSGNSITLDDDNNVYTTGTFGNTVDFDPSSSEFNLTTSGLRDLFILKLDTDGDFIWAKKAGSSSISFWTIGRGIKTDDSGNVYITGSFEGTVDFDPGVSIYNLSSSSDDRDIFVLKLDTSGDFVWAKSFGDESLDIGSGIVLDKSSNLYVSGYFRGIVDFDPSLEDHYLSGPSGISNTFILKLNKDGNYKWAGSFSGSETNFGRSIALDSWDNIYTTGYFKNTTDFASDSTVYELTANGIDTYVHKMKQPCNQSLSINGNNNFLAICLGEPITLSAELPVNTSVLSYSWNSGQISDSIVVAPDTSSTYTVSVSYMSDTFFCTSSTSVEVLVFDPAVISISDDLEICAEDEVFLEATGGSSYLWNTGDTTDLIAISIEEDQTYYITVTDDNDCSVTDSIIVSVNPLPDTTFLEFTTCDSLMTGINTMVYFDLNGCDSIVIGNNVLIQTPEVPVAPADLVIQENEPPFQVSITEIPTATEYIWVVPSGVQILSGQGTNTITVDWGDITTDGFVCVSAINECGNSASNCMEVTVDLTDGITNRYEKSYSIFPNPTSDLLYIVFEDNDLYEIVLLDILGKVAVRRVSYIGQAKIPIGHLPEGVYWLAIVADNQHPIWERIEVVR
ncbi:MAG: hypothetical protein ACI9XB_005227 [Gammaproteobacteria bacterium]|jgi:hypothetical protein